MLLLLARHGESEANLARVFSNRDLPHPLTEAGREDAGRLARALEEFRADVLYCSPVFRARQTAAIVGSLLGLEPVAAEGLREFDVGRWEGTSDVEGWAEYAEVVAAWRAGDSARRVGGGESLDEVVARFSGWLEGLRAAHRGDSVVAAISHGGVLHAVLPRLATNVPQELPAQRPLAYRDVVVCELDGASLRCLQWPGAPPGG